LDFDGNICLIESKKESLENIWATESGKEKVLEKVHNDEFLSLIIHQL